MISTTTTRDERALTRARGARWGVRMVLMTLAVTALALVGASAATDGHDTVVTDGRDAVETFSRPRARFHRLNDRSTLGFLKSVEKGTKKVGKDAEKGAKKVSKDAGKGAKKASKDAKKSVDKATKDVKKSVDDVVDDATDTVNTVSEQATDAYNAGKALAGSTYTDTYNNVKKKFGAKADAFVGDSKDMLQNKYEATKGFTESAVSQLQSEANQLAEDTYAIVQMIVAFFNGLSCDISPSTMSGFINNLVDKFRAGGTSDLVQKLKSEPKKFYEEMDGATCDIVWNTLFTSSSLAIDVFSSAIAALQKDCPAIAGGGVKPAFTLGFTFGVDVTFAARSAGIGTEIGIGFDLEGNKFCYVGACATSGVKFGPNPYDAGAEPGLSLSGFKTMSSVAGECSLIDAGLSVNLPTPLKIEGSAGLTYLYGSGLGDFIGVQYPMSLSNGALVPGAEVSFAKGMCCTPICVKTTGGNCAPTDWKNPCPTATDPQAYLNLITAASQAALGGERTLDRRHEEFPYRRMGDSSNAALGDGAQGRSLVSPALTLAVAAVAFVAVAAQLRRRTKLIADETTPLIRSS